jgi:hypothetical protein
MVRQEALQQDLEESVFEVSIVVLRYNLLIDHSTALYTSWFLSSFYWNATLENTQANYRIKCEETHPQTRD